MEVLEKLEALITELCNNDALMTEKINLEEVKKGVDFFSERMLNRAQERMKLTIPKEDYKFHCIRSLTLDWSSTTNEPNEAYLWGGFQLLSFRYTFSFLG